MQNTQQTTVENVVDIVWESMNRMRGTLSIGEMFMHILYTLYGIHKKYPFYNTIGGHDLFDNREDELLFELSNGLVWEHNTREVIYALAIKLSRINIDDYNAIYSKLLFSLFEKVALNSGHSAGEFYTPSQVTDALAYIASKHCCKSIYDPFCGTASLLSKFQEHNDNIECCGQELSPRTSLYARLIFEASGIDSSKLIVGDSISNWNCNHFDAVISCPPFNLIITPDRVEEVCNHVGFDYSNTIDGVMLTRPFLVNNANVAITLTTNGFCIRGRKDYVVRKFLVDRNLLDAIVFLPSNILYGVGISSIIVVCRTGRGEDEPVKFFNAEDYFIGRDKRSRKFDIERFINSYNAEECEDAVLVPVDSIQRNDYNLTKGLYYDYNITPEKNQKLVHIINTMDMVNGIRPVECKKAISPSLLSNSFIPVILNCNKVDSISQGSRNTYKEYGRNDKGKYILVYETSYETRYGIYTSEEPFCCTASIKVFKVNEELVIPEYLLYSLLNHPVLAKGRIQILSALNLPIVLDNLEIQKDIVNKQKQKYAEQRRKEEDAISMRLGVKNNISDLEHMLGTPQDKINDIIARLENISPSDPTYLSVVKALKDNVEYLNRTIEFASTNISATSFNIRSLNLSEFLENYVNSWKNYGGNYFEISLVNACPLNLSVSLDDRLLTVMLDAILNNAVRHGFHKNKRYTDNNKVEVDSSLTMYNDNSYVLIRVSNNGDPISDSFTIEDYISRGRYTASTGRSGLGGYHVYQVVKGHKGFMRLDSNKQWSTIVEVLLPVDFTSNIDNLYEYECI